MLGPEMASDAHIFHTSKSACNEHVKQCWCETSEDVFEKMTKDWNFYLFWGSKWPQKSGLPGPYSTHL